MSILAPRYPVFNAGEANLSTCGVYSFESNPYLVFKLDSPTHVEYLIATGEAYIGDSISDSSFSPSATCT